MILTKQISFFIIVLCSILKLSASPCEIKTIEEEIIGVWGQANNTEVPMLFITEKYVMVLTKYDKQGSVEDYSRKISKKSYIVTEESSKFYFRSTFWYAIRRKGKDLVLDSNIYWGPFVLDKGVVLKKLQANEVLSMLKDYKLDYQELRNLPIYPISHSYIKDKTQKKSGNPFIPIKDDSLPPLMEKFLSEQGK